MTDMVLVVSRRALVVGGALVALAIVLVLLVAFPAQREQLALAIAPRATDAPSLARFVAGHPGSGIAGAIVAASVRSGAGAGPAATSEPQSDSEKPWHQISSHDRILLRKRFFCSSVPCSMIVGPAIERPNKLSGPGALTRAISSSKMASSRYRRLCTRKPSGASSRISLL